ncbi:MAG TPA: cation transporter [Stellaceae bacterium]|jgi:copper chaperone|nr:cation transporter [Stellaceae bacterium]
MATEPAPQLFAVAGMTCGHCVQALTRAIHGVDAHAEVEIDLGQGRVAIRSAADRRALAHAIEAEGYDVAG